MPILNSFRQYRDLFVLMLIWCGAVALVNPLGDFPLNDDWAYGLNTHALAVENRLYFSDWPAMTLIAHTVWGALFSKMFGFSFTVLRFSTLLFGLFGLAGFYKLLTWAELPRRTVLGCMLLLAFNPLWFVLSNSFMTDVPFLALLMWSTLFFLKTLEKPATGTLLTAMFFALWACLIRQLGLLVPGVFLLMFLYCHPINWRNALFALTPAAICYAAMSAFSAWLERTGQLPEAYQGLGHLWKAFVENKNAFPIAGERAGQAFMLVGLFLLPLGVGVKFRHPGRSWASWVIFLSSVGVVWAAWRLFPVGNVFFNIGLGPKLLYDVSWGDNVFPQLDKVGQIWLLKWPGTFGALFLMLALLPSKPAPGRHTLLYWFFIGFSIVYLVFVCFNYYLIDRYLLPFVPFLMIFMAIVAGRFTKFGWVLLGAYALFSVIATHDYLSWNRARWQVAEQLSAQGVKPEQMDGGFEFNGWHKTGSVVTQREYGLKSWWFVRDNEWMISFGPVWGYDSLFAVPYRRWMPPGTGSVMASRRKTYAVRDSLWCDMERLSSDGTAFLPVVGSRQPGNGNTRSAERAHTGQFSIKLDSAAQTGATLPLDAFQAYDRLVVRVWRYPAQVKNAGIVLLADNVKRGYFFESKNFVQRDSAGWELMEMAVTLPPWAVGKTGRFYLWNTSSQPVWFDDLTLYRLQAK